MSLYGNLTRLALAAGLLGTVLTGTQAQAQGLPASVRTNLLQNVLPSAVSAPESTNLGSTSFYDGFGRTTEGFTLLEYLRYENLTSDKGPDGSTNPAFTASKLQVTVVNTQVGYTSAWHPFGGGVAFSLLVPLVSYSSHLVAAGNPLTTNSSVGVGDIVFGPIFQAAPIIIDGRPVFSWRTQLQITAPTGNYNSQNAINMTNGYFSIAPYLSMTYLPIPKLELSTRLNYMYEFETTQLGAKAAPFENNGQAGPIVFGNFTASYEVLPGFSPGLNGYFERQLADDKNNGLDVHGSLKVQLYAGPGAHFQIDPDTALNLNYYHDIISRNEISGDKINLQLVHRF